MGHCTRGMLGTGLAHCFAEGEMGQTKNRYLHKTRGWRSEMAGGLVTVAYFVLL